jgi:hypothetical protein
MITTVWGKLMMMLFQKESEELTMKGPEKTDLMKTGVAEALIIGLDEAEDRILVGGEALTRSLDGVVVLEEAFWKVVAAVGEVPCTLLVLVDLLDLLFRSHVVQAQVLRGRNEDQALTKDERLIISVVI